MSDNLPPAPGERRWKCLCAYDGGACQGWQSQPGGRAVQDVIEKRIQEIFGRLIRIHGSGRTDAGVHARGQVFHFDAPWEHGPDKLRRALRVGLGAAIQIVKVEEAEPWFHARFSASGKAYHYQLFLGEADPFTRPYVWSYERSLDLAAVRAAGSRLQGRHDFRAFSAVNGPVKEDTVRDVRRLVLTGDGPLYRIEAEADGFLYKMVRSLVGALVAVGEGKMSLADLEQLLASGRRPPLVFTAPAQGLFLVRVDYPVRSPGEQGSLS